MSENVESYDVLSKYYKYIYNHQIFGEKNVQIYLEKLINLVNQKNKFLDIGCGTGIFTEKLCKNFNKIYGIDPSLSMINNCQFNTKIDYCNLYLNEFDEKNFDLITSFSQVINHLDNFDNLYNFIKESSEKLNNNGIFYFDIFNSVYFENNNPGTSKRELADGIYYYVNPTKFEKHDDYILLKLENHVNDNYQKYNYNLNIYIWNLDLILRICQINNLVLIKNSKMLSYDDIDIENYHKISLIFRKKKRIDLLPYKNLNYNNIIKMLDKSNKLKSLTNYGPNVKKLEHIIRNKFHIDDNKSIIVTNNGSSALQTLALGINKYENNNLNSKWVTQSFTFVSSNQGFLYDSKIIDIDDDYFLDLEKVPNDCVGIIVTNIFGNICNIEKYTSWCQKNNKFLIFDSAATPLTFYKNKNNLNYGNGAIISFHHTKALGFGEGGAIIVDKKYEKIIRELINFKTNITYDIYGNNFKMSDINSTFIIEHLKNLDVILSNNKILYKYFLNKIKDFDYITLYRKYYDDDKIFISLIPLIIKNDCELFKKKLEEENVFCKKYYKPLDDAINSNNLFEKVLCIPLHIDMDFEDIDRIINALKY